ncbi:2-succinyl-6-hydroxy-2,4-cyclohexadiene-1-carboxylate synthase [Bacillus sp. FJAT-27225]|uniref:2-succinyl-6-hydroxy-2, 4-cyclohexadiene-1-carboxylate synthase n=1 Tax=Bacillus sp. FJAT-27225 TaxID=1743144 RepID=UPI00080C2BE3|nr:2-succinyl-6-hydroxy-2,4-cyclohexadiene-1-carboxylate synthase [Bacillus sp. FJAT-27225]OCA91471.1 2-succinyl-6-hydroxy-2,4-cyclohexadiene-1-carboxylate synthase [Bacillus sp. FJAT-27225]
MNANINNLNYHVELRGNGTPLLLLHGFTGSSGTWSPFFTKWEVHFKLICPDLPGHGKTRPISQPERFSMDNTVEDLKGILDYLGVEKADVLGYSMGGRIALAFALAYPERVRKLIMESSSPGLEKSSDRKERRMKDSELANFIIDNGVKAFIDYWENIPLFASLQKMPDKITSEVRRGRLENNPEGLAHSLLGIGTGAQPSYWERLGELEPEILLLAGSMDEKFCNIAVNMSKRIKNCKMAIIPEAGHAIHVEQSEMFGTIISGFLTNT